MSILKGQEGAGTLAVLAWNAWSPLEGLLGATTIAGLALFGFTKQLQAQSESDQDLLWVLLQVDPRGWARDAVPGPS